LNIFSDSSLKRMNDTEFVSELIVLIKNGHVDKKNHLDDYFKNDISKEDAAEIKSKFTMVLDKITYLNYSFELAKTRFKQRNDFYTLFDFVFTNSHLTEDHLLQFYKILIALSGDIKPSQNDCTPLRDYARNCVTQSNSKAAREARLGFFNDLFMNKGKKANKIQKEILDFYSLKSTSVMFVAEYLTIDFKALNDIKCVIFK